MANKPNKPKRTREEVDSSNSSMEDDVVSVTKSQLQSMIESTVQKVLKAELKNISLIIDNIDENLNSALERMTTLESKVVHIESCLDGVNPGDIQLVKKDLSSLQKERLGLTRQMNDLENYSRRENFRISGLKEKNGEDPVESVMGFLTHHGFDITKKDIHVAHRVGKKAEGKHRPMIVRLFDRNKRNAILFKRKILKNSGMTISEDVSHLTMQTLIRVQKDDSVSNSWIRHGQVWVIHKDESEKPFTVQPHEQLDDARARKSQ